MEKKAFTLTEIIVGLVILSIVFGGLLAAFTAARKYVLRANRRLVAANLSRSALERLHKEVREDLWDDILGAYPLQPGGHSLSLLRNPPLDDVAIRDIGGEEYSGSYDVYATSHDYREVIATVVAEGR